MNWQQLLSSHRIAGKQKAGQITRSDFEQDYDRIIFSYPFRRLQDKTQVFPLPEEDFVHNRLTHSLEVSSVGRSLGKLVGQTIIERYPDLNKLISATDFGAIVSAASLAHDVGNPPFGHSGESAISDFFNTHALGGEVKRHITKTEWNDLVSFEGNAQGFRLLNNKHYGLQLTYATLGAFSKYPKGSGAAPLPEERVSQKKYGFFDTERPVFMDMAAQLGLHEWEKDFNWSRHPLTFLVEAADDICYHIIDLEDGCTLGLVSLDDTIDLYKAVIGSKFNSSKLQSKRTKAEKLGILRALAISELISQTVSLFLDNEKDILSATFDKALTDCLPGAQALKKIKIISVNKIYRSRIVMEKEVAGFEVLSGLLEVILGAEMHRFSGKESEHDKAVLRILPERAHSEKTDESAYELTRRILDFISGMTDTHALGMYRKFKGMSIPSW